MYRYVWHSRSLYVAFTIGLSINYSFYYTRKYRVERASLLPECNCYHTLDLKTKPGTHNMYLYFSFM